MLRFDCNAIHFYGTKYCGLSISMLQGFQWQIERRPIYATLLSVPLSPFPLERRA